MEIYSQNSTIFVTGQGQNNFSFPSSVFVSRKAKNERKETMKQNIPKSSTLGHLDQWERGDVRIELGRKN